MKEKLTKYIQNLPTDQNYIFSNELKNHIQIPINEKITEICENHGITIIDDSSYSNSYNTNNLKSYMAEVGKYETLNREEEIFLFFKLNEEMKNYRRSIQTSPIFLEYAINILNKIYSNKEKFKKQANITNFNNKVVDIKNWLYSFIKSLKILHKNIKELWNTFKNSNFYMKKEILEEILDNQNKAHNILEKVNLKLFHLNEIDSKLENIYFEIINCEQNLENIQFYNEDKKTIYLDKLNEYEQIINEPIYLFKTRIQFKISSYSNYIEYRNKICEGNLKYAINLAYKYKIYKNLSIDLIQEANQGLLHAIEKFDLYKGYKFSTYAHFWIEQHMKKFNLNIDHKGVRLPNHVVNRISRINKVKREFKEKLDREPTIPEISDMLNIKAETIIKTLAYNKDVQSLNAYTDDNENKELINLVEDKNTICPSICLDNKFLKEKIVEVLSKLNLREQMVLKLRLGLSDGITYTLEEIGHMMNVTRERIRQIEVHAQQNLKNLPEIETLRLFYMELYNN